MSRGGGKRKSTKKKTAVQKAAAKRHANFKRTGVQTHGGTRKNYSKKEARKIENAGLSFSKVTGGAANPLNRAPDNQDVKAGDLMQPVKDFNTFLGTDYSKYAAPSINYNYSERPKSDFSFSDAVRGGARFNEAGRNEVNQNIAGIGQQGPASNIKMYDGKYMIDTGAGRPGNIRLKEGYKLPDTKLAMDNLGGYAAAIGGLGSMTIMGANAIKNMYQNTVPKLKEKLEKRYDTGEDVSSTGIGNLVASLNPVANLANLGIQPASAATLGSEQGFDRASFNRALEGNYDPDSVGGLNIGGNFGLSAEESDRLGRVFQQTPSPRMLSAGGDLQFSDMFEADTQGAKITKGINTIKNYIPIINMLPDLKINSVAEEAQRRYLGFNPNLPSSVLKQQGRGGGGGTRLPMTPTVAQEISPQTQPVPSASTTPTTQTGVDPNRLLQIQQQAYAQAYNPMTIGGFNPQFRFGAATPTIDYSTYFNY